MSSFIQGARIYRFKQDLDQQAAYTGFPNISSRGESCSICKVIFQTRVIYQMYTLIRL